MSADTFIEQIYARFPEETVESFDTRISYFQAEIARIERHPMNVDEVFSIIVLTAEIAYLEAKKAELVVGAV